MLGHALAEDYELFAAQFAVEDQRHDQRHQDETGRTERLDLGPQNFWFDDNDQVVENQSEVGIERN